MPPTRLLTAREVCERLGISRRLLTDLTRTGEVPSIKLGGARRYPEAELERVIAKRTRQAVSA